MSPADRPFVSIIVPCRNEEGYVGKCLESILGSDYPQERLEVLVVDGASDDRTREIVKRYSERHPAIREASVTTASDAGTASEGTCRSRGRAGACEPSG